MKTSDLINPVRIVSPKTQQSILWGWVAALLLLWEFSPSPLLPSMAQVWTALLDLWNNANLAQELLTSAAVILEAIVFATVVSLAFAYLNTIAAMKPIVAFSTKLRFLSMVGLSFFFTLVTANGHALKVDVLAFSISVFFITGMLDVIDGIPREQYDLARTLRMNDWQVLYEVVILGQADQAFDVLRQNAAMGFMMLTLVEGMDRAGGGIGGLLLNSNKHFDLAAIFAIQLLCLGMGLGQDYGIAGLKTLCCPWVKP